MLLKLPPVIKNALATSHKHFAKKHTGDYIDAKKDQATVGYKYWLRCVSVTTSDLAQSNPLAVLRVCLCFAFMLQEVGVALLYQQITTEKSAGVRGHWIPEQGWACYAWNS